MRPLRVALLALVVLCVGHVTADDPGYFWTRVPERGVPPSGRYGYASSYRPSSHEMLYFGGNDCINVYNDFYSFNIDTSSWRAMPVITSTPTQRFYTSGAVLGESFYVYGGRNSNGEALDDLWRFSFATYSWRKMTTFSLEMPLGRFRHELFTIPRHPDGLFLAGGIAPGFKWTDFWCYNVTTQMWTEISVPGWDSSIQPDLVDGVVTMIDDYRFAMVIGPVYELNVYVFDASNVNHFTFVLIDSSATVARPYPRYIFTLTGLGDILYVHAGWSDRLANNWKDLWRFNISTGVWTEIDILPSSERDSFSAVTVVAPDQKSATAYYFGGWGDTVYNDLYSLTYDGYCTTDCEANLIHDSSLAPPTVSYHSSTRLGDSMYVFGGVTKFGVSNDLWIYSMTMSTWSFIGVDTTFPDPRAYHSAVAVGVRMLVFGGQDAAQVSNNELWEYNTARVGSVIPAWQIISPVGVVPTIRWGHCAALIDAETLFPLMVVYGGTSSSGQLFDMWLYDPSTNIWSQLTIGGAGSSSTAGAVEYSAQGRMASMGGRLVALLGGFDVAGYPGKEITIVEIGSTTADFTAHPNASIPIESIQEAMTVLDGHLVSHGGQWFDLLNNATSLFRLAADPDATAIDVTTPPYISYRGGHTAIGYGSSAYFFGGLGTTSNGNNIGVNTLLFNDINTLSLPICTGTEAAGAVCVRCSAGTYLFNGSCVACDAGYYRSDLSAATCSPCAKGFYNQLRGADSALNCLPCDIGYYADTEGSAICMACASVDHCPNLGAETSYDLQVGGSGSDTSVVTTQPGEIIDLVKRQAEVDLAQNWLDILTGASVGLVFVIFIVTVVMNQHTHSIRCWRRMDVLFTLRHSAYAHIGKPVIKMQTATGGLFTVAVFVLILWNSGSVLFPLVIANKSYSRALVSNLLLQDKVIYGNIQIAVLMSHFTGGCVDPTSGQCYSQVFVDAPGYGSDGASSYTTCETPSATECKVTWTCSNCTMKSATSTATFHLNEPGTSLGSYQWLVTTSAGLLEQSSSVRSVLLPPSGYLFRGETSASLVSFRATSLIYDALLNSTHTTGWLLSYVSSEPGSVVSSPTYHSADGAILTFKFSIDDVFMAFTIDTTLKPQLMISVVAGAASAVIGAMSFVVVGIESINGVKNCIRDSTHRSMKPAVEEEEERPARRQTRRDSQFSIDPDGHKLDQSRGNWGTTSIAELDLDAIPEAISVPNIPASRAPAALMASSTPALHTSTSKVSRLELPTHNGKEDPTDLISQPSPQVSARGSRADLPRAGASISQVTPMLELEE